MGMGGGGSGRDGIKSDINVTPLVDVVLVLLIIFMVVTPMLQRGKDVRLPRAESVEKERKESSDPLVVSVTADGRVYLERDELKDEAFEAAVRDKLSANLGRRILLKGDSTLPFEDIRKVMHRARAAGARGVSLGVEEIKK